MMGKVQTDLPARTGGGPGRALALRAGLRGGSETVPMPCGCTSYMRSRHDTSCSRTRWDVRCGSHTDTHVAHISILRLSWAVAVAVSPHKHGLRSDRKHSLCTPCSSTLLVARCTSRKGRCDGGTWMDAQPGALLQTQTLPRSTHGQRSFGWLEAWMAEVCCVRPPRLLTSLGVPNGCGSLAAWVCSRVCHVQTLPLSVHVRRKLGSSLCTGSAVVA